MMSLSQIQGLNTSSKGFSTPRRISISWNHSIVYSLHDCFVAP